VAATVGIDVAKAELVIAIRPAGERWVVSNDDPGIARLLRRVRRLAPALVVLEATGGYERAAVAALATAGIPLVVANPRQVFRGPIGAADANGSSGRAWVWLGGRDLNPDTVVQRCAPTPIRSDRSSIL